MALDYSADNAESATNACYERPGTIDLLPDVNGLRVLDAGCGSGVLTEWLLDHGADVTSIDLSPVMADIALSRVGDRAKVLVADLSRPLSFASDAQFDLVVDVPRHALHPQLDRCARGAPPGSYAKRDLGLLDAPPDDGRAVALP